MQSPPVSRRKLAITALVATSVVGGGVVASGQFAGAASSEGSVAADPGSGSEVDVDADSDPDVEHEPLPDNAFDLPPELEAAFEEFDACMTEDLGDAYPLIPFDEIDVDDVDFDANWNGGVFVETGSLEDLGDFVEFGDGDATVTITKNGDDIVIDVDGDATRIDLEAFEDGELDGDFGAGDVDDEQWEAFDDALEKCEALLPDDIVSGDAIDFVGDLDDDEATTEE